MSRSAGGDGAAPDVGQVVAALRRLGEAMTRSHATAADVAAAVPGTVHDDGPPLGLRVAPVEVAGIDAVTVTRRWNTDEPNAAEVRLASPLTLRDLERHLGDALVVPRAGLGRRRVMFEPAVGDREWTVFSVVDDNDRVPALMVRRDT